MVGTPAMVCWLAPLYEEVTETSSWVVGQEEVIMLSYWLVHISMGTACSGIVRTTVHDCGHSSWVAVMAPVLPCRCEQLVCAGTSGGE